MDQNKRGWRKLFRYPSLIQSSWVKKPIFFFRLLFKDIFEYDLLKQASGMAYVTLLSIVPSLAAVFYIISLFEPISGSKANVVETIKQWVLDNLAAGSGEQVIEYINQFLNHLNSTQIGLSSFAGLFVSLMLMLGQIENVFNRIWYVRTSRNIFTRFAYFWVFLTLGAFLISFVIGFATDFQETTQTNFMQPSESFIGSFLMTWAAEFAFLLLLYKVGPNCSVGLRYAIVGALLSSIALALMGKLYGTYAKDLSNYKNIYGALAALPLFLMWLYIAWLIILFGGVLTRRASEGLSQAFDEERLRQVGAEERITSFRFRSLLPLICLVMIFKKFRSESGGGLSADEIANQLNSPKAWVNLALNQLSDLSYISLVNVGDSDQTDRRDDFYQPALSEAHLSVTRLKNDLLAPMDVCLKDCGLQLQESLSQIIQRLTSPSDGNQKTLSDYL